MPLNTRRLPLAAALIGAALAAPAWAGAPEVVAAAATYSGESDGVEIWRFDVTVRHADTGWDHYADAFEVLDANGVVLGIRTLHHPHVKEQPFTRSLSGVEIPKGAESVFIRAHDSVDGYSLEMLELKLERPE